MLEIARMSKQDRSALVRYAASKTGIHEAIVEKDFWVCFMLDVLFHEFAYSDQVAFKGGTSLSKGYGLIERFSEDIDIILDWRQIGYGIDEPWEDRSNTGQDRFTEDVSRRTGEFLRSYFMPALKDKLDDLQINDYRLYIFDKENEVIRFEYPRTFENDAIVKEIRLEIGSLAAWTPITIRSVKPITADILPDVFDKISTNIRMVEAKRTFWEKATILHDIAHRSGDIPFRYSRHYYDLYQLSKSPIKNQAFKDQNLLEKVVKFKMKFYRSNRARYDLATCRGLQLIPNDDIINSLKKDYNSMQAMIYGSKVPFDDIIQEIKNLQEEIRNL